MRLWYLRRAIAWAPILACLLAAMAIALMVHQWPDVAPVGLPLLIATCAAAAGFLFDEPATAVASVTPRAGWWRGGARLLAGAAPLAASLTLLGTVPDVVAVDRAGWWLAGTAFVVLAAALAAWGARLQVARPGGAIAGAAVLAGLTPVVLALVLGWEPLFPLGDFPTWTQAFWTTAALAGAGGCVGALVHYGRPRMAGAP